MIDPVLAQSQRPAEPKHAGEAVGRTEGAIPSTGATFVQQRYGAAVATILETDNSIVEVMRRAWSGGYQITIHWRNEERDEWHDLSADIKDKHLEMLGSLVPPSQGNRALAGLQRILDFRPDGEMPDVQRAAFALATAQEILKGR